MHLTSRRFFSGEQPLPQGDATQRDTTRVAVEKETLITDPKSPLKDPLVEDSLSRES